jgi:predicted Ser/Thr protein kinase
MEDLTGQQLGPYQIVAPLGEGGMAAVYKAYQPGMERYVALKILPRHFASDPNFVARFEQEAKVLAKLQHPHILPVFDFGEANGYTYIVMPFLQSSDLTALVRTQTLSLAQIRRIISQVGDALDYAHSHGLIHRDVKPSNVLLDERGNCLLTDFGIAKILEGSTKLTATGGLVGTPIYMSPEQGLGEKVDGRSDIYALGIMLYEMATGRVPYQAETPMAVMIKHLNDPIPPPRRLNPALPETVERVILRALAKQPQDRYATAGEMVRALQAAIPETGEYSFVPTEADATLVSAAGATLGGQRQETAERREDQQPSRPGQKWILAAAGLVAVVVVVAGVIIFAGGGNEQPDGATPEAATAAATEGGIAAVQPTEPAIEQTEAAPPVEAPASDTSLPATGVYDNFDDPAFDGTWNTALWEPDSDEPCEVGQQDGAIKFEAPAQPEPMSCALRISQPGLVAVDEIGMIEARLKIADDLSGNQVNIGIGLGTEEVPGGDWFTFCGLTAHPEEVEAYFEVANWGARSDPDISQGVPVASDQWYTFRLEFKPDPLTLDCFVDDTLVGSIQPPDASALRQARFHRALDTYRKADSAATVYADDVRLSGGVETGPTPYDDFDNAAFEGQFDPELWEPWENIANCEVGQEEGALRFSCPQPNGSGLNALSYQEVEFGQIGFVEARLKLAGDLSAEQGTVSVILANSLDSWVECTLSGGAEQAEGQLYCGAASERNGTFTEEYRVDGPVVAYDTWHVVRIEINPESGEFTFFVDGQQIGTHTSTEIEALKTAKFTPELQLYLENGSLATGYFDDVRIGPAE